jgi:class 3 adenylate cyclase
MSVVQTLESAKNAIQRRAWDEAWTALTEADRDEALSPTDLELLADAAWWAGHPDESEDALERAYNGYVAGGMVAEAAKVAALLAYLAGRRLAPAIASGWSARAERLLEGQPPSEAHAYLQVLELVHRVHTEGLEGSVELADQTLELARLTGARDAEALALVFKGSALVSSGRWTEGLALMDEATATALSGELSLRSASDVYCVTIATCRSMADFGRAGEWTEQADRWMTRHAVGGYPGVCQVHRAELKRLHGDWTTAEEEARHACDELRRYHILDGIGLAHNEIGEVRLHLGDLDGAEEAFRNSFEYGWEPQPGLALLKLERGQVDEAARDLERSLSEGLAARTERTDLLTRARLLPAQVEVALARGDLETSRRATEELEMISTEFDRPAFEATALTARGATGLQEGDTQAAIVALERALRLWRDIDFPYEAARTRLLLARAHLKDGDPGRARMELEAARSTFERLGAVLDLRRVEEVLYLADKPSEARSRVVKTFMFTDIVTSTDLVGLIGDAAWESLLAWHDRELRAAFAAHRGVEVSHTGDGFFVTFDRAADAIEAAVAIQRRLSEHRRNHGFAPSVRIGLHTSEATVDGADYRGQGVHVAARVGGAADADEILISSAAFDAVDNVHFQVSDPRSIDLKGVPTPVEVRVVDWQ